MSWEDFDDLLHGPEGGPPPRIRYERNAALLDWLAWTWLGVNREGEGSKAIKALPNVAIPSRYRRLPATPKVCYRGLKVTQEVMDKLLTDGEIRLRKNGLASWSLDYGVAAEFAVLGPALVIEKSIRRKDVRMFVPAMLDDAAWADSKASDRWEDARRELNWAAREQELLVDDADPYWRTIKLLDCVRVDDGRSAHASSGKSIARRMGLTEGQQSRAATILLEMQRLSRLLLENRIEWLAKNVKPRLLDALRMSDIDLPWGELTTGDDSFRIPERGAPQEEWEQAATGLFNHIIGFDPDEKGKSNSQWLLQRVIDGGVLVEDLPRAKETLAAFAAMKRNLPPEQRDIMRFKRLSDLTRLLRGSAGAAAPWHSGDAELDAKMHEQAEVIYDSPAYKIIIPKTVQASCYFGAKTEWCTARYAPDDSRNQFEHYSKRGPLYIVLEKATGTRWQFHWEADQFMDVDDAPIDLESYAKEHPEVATFFDQQIPVREPDAVVGPYRLYMHGERVGSRDAVEAETGTGLGLSKVLTISHQNGEVEHVTKHSDRIPRQVYLDLLRLGRLRGGAPLLSIRDIYYQDGKWGSLSEVGTKLLRTQGGLEWYEGTTPLGYGGTKRHARLYNGEVSLLFANIKGNEWWIDRRDVLQQMAEGINVLDGIADLLIANPAMKLPTETGAADYVRYEMLHDDKLQQIVRERPGFVQDDAHQYMALKSKITPMLAEWASQKLGIPVEPNLMVLRFDNPRQFIEKHVTGGAGSKAAKMYDYLASRGEDGLGGDDLHDDLVSAEASTDEIVRFLKFIEETNRSLMREIEDVLENRAVKNASRIYAHGKDRLLYGYATEINDDDELSDAFNEAIKNSRRLTAEHEGETDFWNWLTKPAVPRTAGGGKSEVNKGLFRIKQDGEPITSPLRMHLVYDMISVAMQENAWPQELRFFDYKPDFDFFGATEDYVNPIWNALELAKWDNERDAEEKGEDADDDGERW